MATLGFVSEYGKALTNGRYVPGFFGFETAGLVMLFVTLFAPHLFAMFVATPLLPASLAVPVKVATPPLTAAENP